MRASFRQEDGSLLYGGVEKSFPKIQTRNSLTLLYHHILALYKPLEFRHKLQTGTLFLFYFIFF